MTYDELVPVTIKRYVVSLECEQGTRPMRDAKVNLAG